MPTRNVTQALCFGVFLVVAGCRSHQGFSVEGPLGSITIPAEHQRLPQPFVTLDGAVAFDVSPDGEIHVIVNDPARIQRFTMDGRSSGSLGGPGTRAGAFSDPADLVSTALFVTVADKGNGRIQRFDRDGGLVEVVPLDAGSDVLRPYFTQNSDGAVAGSSRPEAVVETSSGGLIVADSRSGRVFLVDRMRERAILTGIGDVRTPLDLALSGRHVVVLDGRGDRLVILDALGSVVRTVHSIPLRSISAHSDGLLGATDVGFVSFSDSFEPVAAVQFMADTPRVVAVRRYGGYVLVLTSAGLHRILLEDRWFRPGD